MIGSRTLSLQVLIIRFSVVELEFLLAFLADMCHVEMGLVGFEVRGECLVSHLSASAFKIEHRALHVGLGATADGGGPFHVLSKV